MSLTISGVSTDIRTERLAYRPGQSMPCPACGERQWIVGRMMAECACCETALPIDAGYRGWTGAVSQPVPTPPERFPIA